MTAVARTTSSGIRTGGAQQEQHKQEFIARMWTLVRELLHIEAKAELTRDAEIGASEDHHDMTTESKAWYGTDVLKVEHQRLKAMQLAAEVALGQATDALTVAEIRESGLQAACEQYQALEERLTDLEQQLWQCEQQAMQAIAERREQLVHEKAAQLEQRYLTLSTDFPMNANHPAVPAFLHRWVTRQQQRGAFAVPVYRLLTYLVLRDAIFTGVLNVAPVIEDDDLPVLNPLEAVGLPRSKAEQRMNLMLAEQFMHENGDRRVARETPLSALHQRRIDAAKMGDSFVERIDFEQGSDYVGLPVLKALVNPEVVVCGECGGPIKDNIVVLLPDGWTGVTKCDCTTEEVTAAFSQYDAAVEALLQHRGQSDKILLYRQQVAQRRAVQRALREQLVA